MLAAASAWRILEAEHTRLRQLLAAIARVLESEAWKDADPPIDVLREAIASFQAFEAEVHHPKGVVLLKSLRGRSPAADTWLDRLDRESEEADRLMAEAVSLTGSSPADAPRIALLLQQHRELVMQLLEEEDTVLRSYTSDLLTPQEWSAVVSSISSVVQKRRARRES